MDRKPGRLIKHLIICIIMVPMLLCGCSHSEVGGQFREANDLFSQGNYNSALGKYQQIIAKEPTNGDRVLFEMAIIHAHPGNQQKDYQKSLQCFQKIIKDYPQSSYRKDSELMIFNINNVIGKDRTIAAQLAQIETLRQELQGRGEDIVALRNKIEALEQAVRNRDNELVALGKEAVAILQEPADRILIEKKARRLTLFSNGRVLKTYRIALGGNPEGPKERQGDNKTPEGNYIIDSRNENSLYHLSLHISYPNEQDKKRAKRLGVAPGGDIMIHGIKNGFSWAGDHHTGFDWTKGCIAVTDEEIEEIDRLAPIGTSVEIRP